MSAPVPFWKSKTLEAMSREEWESLCDGCGRCCLHKLRFEPDDSLGFTNVACRLLDLQTGQCSRYADRFRWVPDCVQLTPAEVQQINWLPVTCAYRLLAEGKPLPNWHPLITGDRRSTQRAGMGMCGWALPERRARRLEDHIIEWPLS